MKCQRCSSERLMESMGKASDCQIHSIQLEHSGGLLVPGVLEGDYIRFKLCLNCGQVQGRFPAPRILLLETECDEDDKLARDDILTAWGIIKG